MSNRIEIEVLTEHRDNSKLESNMKAIFQLYFCMHVWIHADQSHTSTNKQNTYKVLRAASP